MSSRDRAALRHLEPARAIHDRSRERPALVPEQLRLDQVLEKIAQLTGTKGLMTPPARLVNQVRDHLLAGAGLARDEDRAVTVGNDPQKSKTARIRGLRPAANWSTEYVPVSGMWQGPAAHAHMRDAEHPVILSPCLGAR
jgi:hypothetical protein